MHLDGVSIGETLLRRGRPLCTTDVLGIRLLSAFLEKQLGGLGKDNNKKPWNQNNMS